MTMILLFIILSFPAAALVSSGCDYAAQTCGGISVPYPFGMSPECGLPDFRVFCHADHHSHSYPYIIADNDMAMEVLSFSTSHLIVNSYNLRTTICQGPHISTANASSQMYFGLNSQKGIALSSENTFLVSGCSFAGVFEVYPTVYVGKMSAGIYGSCTDPCGYQDGWDGRGSCKVQFPTMGAKAILLESAPAAWSINVPFNQTLCGYSVIYSESILQGQDYAFNLNETSAQNYGLKLTWGLPIDGPSYNCSNLPDHPDYACAPHSECVDVPNIVLLPGVQTLANAYACNCTQGYRGDGYRNGTQCKDIDECLEGLDDCVKDPSLRVCTNTPGSFVCGCLAGAEGNGIDMHNHFGTGCTVKRKNVTVIAYMLEGVLGCIVLVTSTYILARHLWKLHDLRWKKALFLKMNGGLKLQEFICSPSTLGKKAPRLFSHDELKKATRNFAPELKLGAGGHGTVYKGHLKDGTIVAIKRPFQYNPDSVHQFINEIIILSQISHRNIVPLLGCCLETEIPLLVYEYVSNGTLYEHLHGSNRVDLHHSACIDPLGLGWENRLSIAIECAEAFGYLHSSLSTPIFHRDIKSSNILLDKTLTPKVSDFGLSRLVPTDTHMSTLFQGTLGYLDPEYFKTSRFTDKSDVYSFGVLLLELITALKPSSSEVQVEHATANGQSPQLDFVTLCTSSMESGNFCKLVDRRMKADENPCIMLSICCVANMAASCVHVEGRNRPTMKSVYQKLLMIKASMPHDVSTCMELMDKDATNNSTETASWQTNP